MRYTNIRIGLFSLVFVIGCASLTTKKNEQIETERSVQAAEADVRTAREAGAATYAPTDLQEAERDLKSAKAKLQKKEYSSADTLAQSAISAALDALNKTEVAKKKEGKKKQNPKTKSSEAKK
ncbi:MAG: DUF4398 domain-containing protein [Elusimicrobia bacterium]|nr:DUF4398 domain-containing protein [Elusimicrobiota bacterium]